MYTAFTILALGGAQNPLEIGIPAPEFIDGLWDGLTWTPLAIYDFFGGDVDLVDHSAPTDAYVVGVMFGLPLFFVILRWLDILVFGD